jgi:hypothetical protein
MQRCNYSLKKKRVDLGVSLNGCVMRSKVLDFKNSEFIQIFLK